MKKISIELTDQRWLAIIGLIGKLNINKELKLSILHPVVKVLVEELGQEAVDEALR
jgi:hypothetical protein